MLILWKYLKYLQHRAHFFGTILFNLSNSVRMSPCTMLSMMYVVWCRICWCAGRRDWYDAGRPGYHGIQSEGGRDAEACYWHDALRSLLHLVHRSAL